MADTNPKPRPSIAVDDMVSGPAELADKLGVTLKTFESLATERVAVRIAHGQYLVFATIKNYIERLRRTASGREGESAKEKQRLLAAQARMAEFKESLMRGDVLSKSTVVHDVNSTFFVVRSAVLAAKARIGNHLPHLSRLDLVEIDNELRSSLTALGECRYNDDTAWTVSPDELAEQVGLTREAVDRFAKAGVLPAPDSEGRVSLWGSIRAIVALRPEKGVESNERNGETALETS
jgi:phage terminase Nu1 subunit (DNA packaging protein)